MEGSDELPLPVLAADELFDPFGERATTEASTPEDRPPAGGGIRPARAAEEVYSGMVACVKSADTATAAAMFAELEKIRKCGYSTDAEEFVDGMIAVAVPVTGPKGNLAATVSFHAPTQRLSLNQACEFVPVLKKTAEGMAVLVS